MIVRNRWGQAALLRKGFWIFLALLLVGGGVAGIKVYQAHASYAAYRKRIQQGVKVAGIEVGWLTPEEARAKVYEEIAQPYYRDLVLHDLDKTLTLSPAKDLGFEVPVEAMVAEAMAASHQYEYWAGFKLWLQGKVEPLDLDVPLRMSFDKSAASRFLAQVAKEHDTAPIEPKVDVQKLAFIPGRPGYRLDIQAAAARINDQVLDPGQREIQLPVKPIEPDQSHARIESMVKTLAPVMERPPTPPSFYTATIPISTTGGLEGTPLVTYTGELTWTFPHFAAYTGPLTTTTGFFFDPGKPGYTLNVQKAIRQVEMALRAGVTHPISLEPDLVPPPPITPGLLLPPLKARLAQFPGVTSILVKNLDTGELIYESHSDYVLAGMSIVKIGIMVEVYRYFGGKVDTQTHQELLDMLGSSSCNPCANRLLAAVGNGSATEGARRVTATMHRLGLSHFYLCAPFRIVQRQPENGPLVWTAYRPERSETGQPEMAWLGPGGWIKPGIGFLQTETPRYDRCVRATPREMANLMEMIYRCTQDNGLLRKAYPNSLTPAVCQEMIDIMAANDLRNMLGAGIPAEVKLAHKHGFSGYDVPWGDTRGEVGIVFSPEATWLISFYIWQDTPWINWGINQPLYRDVSNMLYNYFNPHQPYWPLPPWTPLPEEDTGEAATL